MDASIRRSTFVRVEVRLDTPSNIGELGKAMANITAQAAEDGIDVTFDDTISVSTEDDCLVLWYTMPLVLSS
jgi:hypothetical protein